MLKPSERNEEGYVVGEYRLYSGEEDQSQAAHREAQQDHLRRTEPVGHPAFHRTEQGSSKPTERGNPGYNCTRPAEFVFYGTEENAAGLERWAGADHHVERTGYGDPPAVVNPLRAATG